MPARSMVHLTISLTSSSSSTTSTRAGVIAAAAPDGRQPGTVAYDLPARLLHRSDRGDPCRSRSPRAGLLARWYSGKATWRSLRGVLLAGLHGPLHLLT